MYEIACFDPVTRSDIFRLGRRSPTDSLFCCSPSVVRGVLILTRLFLLGGVFTVFKLLFSPLNGMHMMTRVGAVSDSCEGFSANASAVCSLCCFLISTSNVKSFSHVFLFNLPGRRVR